MGLNSDHRGSRSSRPGDRGATLAELLVVLVIVSILAVVTVPMAETSVQRRKEVALRETLRDVRSAIDRFHADWEAEVIAEGDPATSEDGWPVQLSVLVEGVEDTEGKRRRYLRQLPRNPFAPDAAEPQDAWRILGYADPPDALVWNGTDVYDLRPRSEKTALDGTEIADW
ncbi:MAG: type II secretion system protein [Rhodobacteraceae bacterium]|nr:type II secretion system protein [Paracoccaceae bacterium]